MKIMFMIFLLLLLIGGMVLGVLFGVKLLNDNDNGKVY